MKEKRLPLEEPFLYGQLVRPALHKHVESVLVVALDFRAYQIFNLTILHFHIDVNVKRLV